MKTVVLVILASTALAYPAYAQQNTTAAQMQGTTQAATGQQAIPVAGLSKDQLRSIQEALNKSGFDSGHVDGIWGEDTGIALDNFQKARKIKASRELDGQTVSALGLNPQQFASSSANQSASNAGSTNTPDPEMNSTSYNSADIKAFENIKLSMANAVSMAEQHANGNKVANVAFSQQNGSSVFRVRTYGNNSMQQETIDANSGQMIGTSKTTAEGQLDPEDKAELNALLKAKTQLSEAVKAVEQKSPGKIVSAGLEQMNGKVAYQVSVVSNGSVASFHVDPNSGQVTSG